MRRSAQGARPRARAPAGAAGQRGAHRLYSMRVGGRRSQASARSSEWLPGAGSGPTASSATRGGFSAPTYTVALACRARRRASGLG